jgi:hypothetical protein
METRAAINAYLDHVQSASIVGPVTRQDSLFVRSCSSIPATLC